MNWRKSHTSCASLRHSTLLISGLCQSLSHESREWTRPESWHPPGVSEPNSIWNLNWSSSESSSTLSSFRVQNSWKHIVRVTIPNTALEDSRHSRTLLTQCDPCDTASFHELDHQISNTLWWQNNDAKWSLTVTFFLGLLRIDITNFVNFMRKFSSHPLTFPSVMLRRGLEIRQWGPMDWRLSSSTRTGFYLVTAFHWVVSWEHIHLGLLQSVSLICFLLETMRRPSNQCDQQLTH